MDANQAYDEICRLAREHALVWQAAGGAVTIVHPETQKQEGIYEKIQWMHGLGPHPDSESACLTPKEPDMHLTDNEAAIKLAERDNLVGELVEALQEAHALLTNERIGTWQYMESSQFYSDANGVVQKIAAVLAKAREGAQS